MLALHIALFALLGSSLVLSVVQLGLTAYVVTFWGGTRRQYSYSLSDGYSYRTIRASTPEILAFLVFVACWSILVTIAGLVLPWFYTRKGTTTGKLNTILGIGFAVAYGVTMVFWLAGFGDLVAKLGGASSSDYVNAVIAFAVILWLVLLIALGRLHLGLTWRTCLGFCSSPSSPSRSSHSVEFWSRNGRGISRCARTMKPRRPGRPTHRSPMRQLMTCR